MARGVTEVGKLIPQGELGLYGFPFSRTHLARLVQAGRLPEPVKVGYGKGARNFYDEDELLAARARADAEARRRAAERPFVPITTGKRSAHKKPELPALAANPDTAPEPDTKGRRKPGRQAELSAPPTRPDTAPRPDNTRKRGAR